MTPKLSILIGSLREREASLKRLLANLEVQMTKDVEILISRDAGQKTIGEKRNQLLDKARGEYLCFIDDDDLVAPNYIELILKALETQPDAVGINLVMTWDGAKSERAFHQAAYKNKPWHDAPDSLLENRRAYFRGPNHLNPVRRSIALRVKFPESSKGEDRAYSCGICKIIETMVSIEQPIYFYLYDSGK